MRPCRKQQFSDWKVFQLLRSFSLTGSSDDVNVFVRKLHMTKCEEALQQLQCSTDTADHERASVLDTFRETGFSQKRLLDFLLTNPELLSKRTIQCIRRCQEFFDSLNISRKQASHVLTVQPRLLDPASGKEMYSRIQFLRERLSDVSLRCILLRYPEILKLSIAEDLEPLFEYFASLGLHEADAEIILAKEPAISSLSLISSIQPTIQVLKNIFHKDWTGVLLSHPGILLHSHDRLRAVYNALVRFTRWREAYFAAVLKKEPLILTVDPSTITIVAELLHSTFRWPPSDIRHFIRRCPQILTYESEESLHATMHCLLGETRRRKKIMEYHIRSSPGLLLLDPERDIEPRLTFLSVQGIKTPESRFRAMLLCSNEEFAENHAGVHPKEFNAFLQRRHTLFSATGGDLDGISS